MQQPLAISGETRLAAFFAHPARHSISPKMHNLAFQYCQIDARYLAFDVLPEDLATSIQAIRSLNLLGVNLSMPHKQTVLQHLDQLSEAAQLIGAVNTIVNDRGVLIGHNTDGLGFMRSLKDISVDVIGREMTVLGAGGASTAIVCQAALDGVKQIYVISRRGKNYENMQEKIKIIQQQTACQVTLIESTQKDAIRHACQHSQLLINGTNVGMGALENQLPLIDASLLRSELAVCDIIYHPTETLLLKQAKATGAKTANGLGMLFYQGAAAFELWTKQEMPKQIFNEIQK
ncbi:shikimate dehydrogenase [Enterococcus sp. LJL98]